MKSVICLLLASLQLSVVSHAFVLPTRAPSSTSPSLSSMALNMVMSRGLEKLEEGASPKGEVGGTTGEGRVDSKRKKD